jgi:hypothetical protein
MEYDPFLLEYFVDAEIILLNRKDNLLELGVHAAISDKAMLEVQCL